MRSTGMMGLSIEINSLLNNVSYKRFQAIECVNIFSATEPATGSKLVDVYCSGLKDVNHAVNEARLAFSRWKSLHITERCEMLRKAGDIVLENKEELAKLEVLDSGKAIYEARDDIKSVADTLRYYASIGQEAINGKYIPQRNGSYSYVKREPLGVCVGIGAWNYPLFTCIAKVAPALCFGNTMVFKPSPFTPFSAVHLASVFEMAGIPPGVYSVIQGDGVTGELLCTHPDVRKISFTGSVDTGKKVIASSASGIKQVTLELGGKSPLIVFSDADVSDAVTGAMMANFYTQGEVCSNASLVFVHDDIIEEFAEKLLSAMKRVKIGDPMLEETTMGAMISREHAEKVLGYVSRAKDQGGKVVYGGDIIKMPDGSRIKGGAYITPCLIRTNWNPDMEILGKEVFGPVVTLIPFTSEEEVIRWSNRTEMGLAAGVFTRDLSRAHRVIGELDAGSCYVNTYNTMPMGLPFGGFKMSGYGRENSADAVESYTQLKSVYVETGRMDGGLLCP